MFLIVGLGNPDEKYKFTRHNLGFMVVDQLAKYLNTTFKKRNLFKIANVIYKANKVVLLKPLTYMNLSGRAVAFIVNKNKIHYSNILVICDDFNLPFGKIRIRGQGSDGGHHGLASIIDHLNTLQFPRLRIGIGSNFPKNQTVDFVLSSFTVQQLEIIKETIAIACQAVLSFIERGLTDTMNEYN